MECFRIPGHLCNMKTEASDRLAANDYVAGRSSKLIITCTVML